MLANHVSTRKRKTEMQDSPEQKIENNNKALRDNPRLHHDTPSIENKGMDHDRTTYRRSQK